MHQGLPINEMQKLNKNINEKEKENRNDKWKTNRETNPKLVSMCMFN